MADWWLDSSSDEEDGMDEIIDALYTHVIRRDEEISRGNSALNTLSVGEISEEILPSDGDMEVYSASDDEAEIEEILREIYESVDQEDGRMEIEQTASQRVVPPAHQMSHRVRNEENGHENTQVEREAGGRVVEASPPPRGLQEECEDNLNVEVGDFLYLHNTRTFFNKKFNLTGTMYTVRVDNRPETRDRLDAFNAVLQDLELAMLREIGEDDYIQLRFMSSDLNNPFILPVVRRSMYDSLVASEIFSRILPSNAEVDVGRGDFTIDVYHTRIPRGGGLVKEYGKTVEKLLKQQNSVIVVPPQLSPHCLVLAKKVAVLAMERKHKHFLRIDRKRQIHKLTSYAKMVRGECGLPLAGELKVTDSQTG